MKGGTRKTATPMPLSTPMEVPAPKPARQPMRIAPVAAVPPSHALTMAMDVITETMANMTPTERSRPAVSSTTIWPMETITR